MNTPELPDPVFDDGDHLPPEVELPELADPTPNPLFDNLVPLTPENRLPGRMSFTDAMPEMGMSSVFDIIRQPKAEFTRQLRTLSDADGELAYDNALCYATQIARSYREDVVSSGRNLPQIAPQTGVRALVDIGPSYPNLFKENWDQFCKVGAIEAMDGPVAYLGSLRRFAQQKIEGASTSPLRIPLAVRRPDLDSLVIDEQSTYQSVPMLDLVNSVLSQGIAKYQTQKGDARPIHQLLAEKKHPFVFPYHFAHQQVSLALEGDKPVLGALNLALRTGLQASAHPVDQRNALALLSGLSPAQQHLLLADRRFPAFNLSLQGPSWYTPIISNIHLWDGNTTHIEIPEQESVISVLHTDSDTLIEMRLINNGRSQTVKLRGRVLQEGAGGSWKMSHQHADGNLGICFVLYYKAGDNPGVELALHYDAPLVLNVMVTVAGQSRLGRQMVFDVSTLGDPVLGRDLNVAERDYLQAHLAIDQRNLGESLLNRAKVFCDKTGVDAEQLTALLSQKDHSPHISPNCPIRNKTGVSNPLRRSPTPMNYGAVFINGNGAIDRFKPRDNSYQYNNAVSLVEETLGSERTVYLAYTSLDRFDRMQRMIRLQRWTKLPFAELDTLIVSAMRAEGDANPDLTLNPNTLRMLGAYRYLNGRHGIGAEEFAAFVHDVSAFASGTRTPLFDQVFNNPVLFGTPLVLDHGSFSHTSDDPAHQATVNQLCAGLGLTPEAFAAVALQTIEHVGPLNRSLLTVSALYRLTRIARLFRLEVEDCLYLIECLGGRTYLRHCTVGTLLQGNETQTDVLDILIHLDGVVDWLGRHKLSVAKMRTLLAVDAEASPTTGVLERLQQLASDGRSTAVTPAAVAALALPGKATGATIDWFSELGKGANALIDSAGLIKPPNATVAGSDHAQLAAQVRALIATLGLGSDDVAAAETRLTAFLLDARARQQRLVEGLLQEHTTLLPELAVWVAHCADVSPYRLLERTLQAWPMDAEPDAGKVSAVLADLRQIDTCTRAVSWAKVGTAALRTFVVNPAWLGCESLWPLSLNTLHLLKAYDSLFNTLGQPEERLLGYVQQANALASRRPGKRQLAVQSQTCNAALASLLGWSESEVAVLTALLPQQTAKTVAHIDWVRRAQALSLETGLDAATLLKACSLHADSPEADWQAVGHTAMAAVSR